ncbi:hypothetical protein VNO77_37867 [Canavalia gladiata]|uniref:Uncharacterized protein n=1 Tax=Canavalia gladiata TaxID=3824 RepID=A0AAN9KAN0_CANGL
MAQIWAHYSRSAWRELVCQWPLNPYAISTPTGLSFTLTLLSWCPLYRDHTFKPINLAMHVLIVSSFNMMSLRRGNSRLPIPSFCLVAHLGDKQDNFEDQVKALEAKLFASYSELNNKDNLVKQHAKVFEEVVSGWEKADAEVGSLRHQLESLSLSKLIVDKKAAHLDGALKECMKQIRTIREESEQKLQEVNKLEEGLRDEVGENVALLRSLQERSNKIVKLKEYTSEIEAEELDIRNEEKNIMMRSAEVENKQHKEGVKNNVKLEEAESSQHVINAPHLRKTCSKTNNLQESEFLPKQLEVLEKETKKLKEAFASISIPDHSDIRMVSSLGKFENRKSETILELMDDFLEVEKMACLSDNGNVPLGIINKANGNASHFEEILLPITSDFPLCLKSNCDDDDDSSCQQSSKNDMLVAGDSKVDTEVEIIQHPDVATAVSSFHHFGSSVLGASLRSHQNEPGVEIFLEGLGPVIPKDKERDPSSGDLQKMTPLFLPYFTF